MAMPKKGARIIVVNHKTYFWKVIVDEDLFSKGFIIESVDHQDYQISGAFDYEENHTISPNMINQVICSALKDGWNPGNSQDKKYYFKDYSKLKIKTSAIWKPAFFNSKQVLKKGVIDTFYFNRSPNLNFSWGNFDIVNDFKASCKIDQIFHETYGEIYAIESIGEEFIIQGAQIQQNINIKQIEDVETWKLTVELSEFIMLPKRTYKNI